MSQSLCFNDFTFSPITRDNQPWFKSSEIARALGYKREDKVTQIYQRNADEFTEASSACAAATSSRCSPALR